MMLSEPNFLKADPYVGCLWRLADQGTAGNRRASLLERRGKNLTPQKFLRDKGMKATALRRQVLGLFFERQEPMSHADISRRLTALGPTPDKVTLYRVLSAFSDAQIVHEILGTDGTVRFCLHKSSLDRCPGNHPHFLCRECGRALCLHEQRLPRVEVPEGTIIEGKQFLIFGLCPQCAQCADETNC